MKEEENKILELIDDGEDCGSHGVMFDIDIYHVAYFAWFIAWVASIVLYYTGYVFLSQWIFLATVVVTGILVLLVKRGK